MAELRLHVEGPDAEAAAAELACLVEAEFGVAPSTTRQAPQHGPDQRGDPLALAALILSVPGAVLATMDIAERIRLKDKLASLIALARGLRGRATVRLDGTDGLRDLGSLTPDAAVDFLARPGP